MRHSFEAASRETTRSYWGLGALFSTLIAAIIFVIMIMAAIGFYFHCIRSGVPFTSFMIGYALAGTFFSFILGYLLISD